MIKMNDKSMRYNNSIDREKGIMSQKKTCKEANAFYLREYDKIKAHITEVSQAVLQSAYNNKGLNKLPPDARLQICMDIIIKRLSKDFQVRETIVRDWLLFDYVTEITKIDME